MAGRVRACDFELVRVLDMALIGVGWACFAGLVCGLQRLGQWGLLLFCGLTSRKDLLIGCRLLNFI